MSETFELGPYVVRLALRADNPAFPVHIISKNGKQIGRQFSRPNLDDCRSLEREQKAERGLRNHCNLPAAFHQGEGFHNDANLGAHRKRGPGRPRKEDVVLQRPELASET